MSTDGPYRTLVDCPTLAEHLDAGWAVIDCRFDLGRPAWGRKQYRAGHIPGAVYAHLDADLSGPPVTDRGRHPLPTAAALEETFSRLGIGETTQVVAYDQREGMIAARLWWLLRFAGHDAVAVLDGGWKAWLGGGWPAAGGEERRPPAVFRARLRGEWLVRLEQVGEAALLVDARTPERYRGEREPLDPVAGHIPGARNHPYQRNLDEHGRFLPRERLRERLEALLAPHGAAAAVHYCGSGVSACHNLLACAVAGLEPGRLYAGSWSEWCADPGRPMARGTEG